MKKKIGLTIGVFDMLHEGHVSLFEAMKAEGADCIHVILHDDVSTFQNKRRFPVQNTEHREKNLELSGHVCDSIVTYDADPSELISYAVNSIRSMHGFDCEIFFMRGDDWKDCPGREVIEEAGIPIKFKPYHEGISSTKRRKELC